MEIIEFQSNKEASKYIKNCKKRMIEILERIDSSFDLKFDNDNEELLFDRANKILLHDPHITKEKEELIHEIFAMEVNVIHIHEVLKNHERGFDKGIKLVKLDRAPVVKCPKMEIAGKVTPAQIASVEINSRDRLNQNARRRDLGAEGFNGRYFQ